MKHRIERDPLGEVKVPEDAYWGAVTQRSIENFRISGLRLQRGFIKAMGTVKLASIKTNHMLGLLPDELANALISAAGEVLDGKLDQHFPVDVFQTGSGTHTNMNANEVIANRAIELLGGVRGSKLTHPNDHVNLSQSSNDVIPTAMHISVLEALSKRLIPSLERLENSLTGKSGEFKGVVKTGRTHLMDAIPVTLGLEFATYAGQIKKVIKRLKNTCPGLLELSIGGTAVGTGYNTPKGFSAHVVEEISRITGYDFKESQNKGELIAFHDSILETSGVLRLLSVSLTKIANDIRWLSSGPRAGLGEISIPENEPGSSIMPGKVNPTQAEALLMVCAQVMGNDLTISFAGAQGNFELNAMKPVMAYNILQSIEILANSVESFTDKCVAGIKVNQENINKFLEGNLMLVTALVPRIGYDRAAQIARHAAKTGRSIRDIALEQKAFSSEELEELLDPKKFIPSE
jgi:fumarate hydratase class II